MMRAIFQTVALGRGIKMKKLSLEEAVTLMKKHPMALRREMVDLLAAAGRVAAADIKARHDQPPFDRSPLDGYAVMGEDTTGASKAVPSILRVVEEVHAGSRPYKTLKPGQAIRIMTGAPMPKGSNAVIRQEDTDEGTEVVQVFKAVHPYSNYCYAGEDYHQGQVLVREGDLLSAAHIGVLASNGISRVSVIKKPRIGLLSTGSELVNLNQPLSAGKIYNSNLYTISARLEALGCVPVPLGTIADDVAEGMRRVHDHWAEVDMLITTGGVSVGKMDIMHPIYKGLNISPLFWRIAIKPGTPVLSGIYKEKLILSLSGNPSAAAVTFELLFRPYLSEALGCDALDLWWGSGLFCDTYTKESGTRRFIKAREEGGNVWLTQGNQSSGALKAMVGCNCFIDVKESEALTKGQNVSIVRW